MKFHAIYRFNIKTQRIFSDFHLCKVPHAQMLSSGCCSLLEAQPPPPEVSCVVVELIIEPTVY